MTTRVHGSHVRYVQGPDENDSPGRGCRCAPCRHANRDYEKERAQRIEPAYVDAGPARAHLRSLMAQGIGPRSVAQASGVSTGALSKILYGDYGRRTPPSRRIRPSTAQRILAVNPSTFTNDTREPAGPVLALVDRLVSAGVPKVRIAERIGQRNALQLGVRGNQVSRRHASVIRQMAAELDAGTLVTVKRHRNGARVIAPVAAARSPRTRAQADEFDALYLTLAEILEERVELRSWRKDSACRGRASWLFFPSKGDAATLAAAKRVCAACIVRARCLEAHVGERDGVWGGLSGNERRTLRAERALEAAS